MLENRSENEHPPFQGLTITALLLLNTVSMTGCVYLFIYLFIHLFPTLHSLLVMSLCQQVDLDGNDSQNYSVTIITIENIRSHNILIVFYYINIFLTQNKELRSAVFTLKLTLHLNMLK